MLVALLQDESLLVPDALTAALVGAVHDRAAGPLRVAKVVGLTQVEVGLRRESLRAALVRLEAALAQVPIPTSNEVVAAVHAARRASLRRALCLRQRALVPGANCQPIDSSAAERQLAEVFAGVELRPVYEGGIPWRDQVWLRPLRVEAVFHAGGEPRPLPDLPLRIQSSAGAPPTAARTGANGVFEQAIAERPTAAATWTVTFDAERMLGSLAKVVPSLSISLGGRATGCARIALVHAKGKPPIVETAQAVLAALTSRVPRPVELAEPDARQLAEASAERMKEVAPALADRMRGALDTVLLLEAESEFASRMETQRVWYEARGTLRGFDAWTGDELAEVSATVTESGLGEPRAERAAREALGRELARRLDQQLRTAPARSRP